MAVYESGTTQANEDSHVFLVWGVALEDTSAYPGATILDVYKAIWANAKHGQHGIYVVEFPGFTVSRQPP